MANEDLNPDQLKAAKAGNGPVMIIAGPGTGKTKTLVSRIVYLVSSNQAEPAQILALTFTKKAAEEMQARVAAALPDGREKPYISTFHALCYEILGQDLSFIDEPARLKLIKDLPKPAQYKGFSSRELGLLISRYKNMAENDLGLQKLTEAYNLALSTLELSDFDDILVLALAELKNNEDKRRELQQKFKYVLVDEFQDTNLLQYELLKVLLGHDNLFVIGDPNQSIYGFRGAGSDIFAQLKKDYPGLSAVELTINYRSTPEVVNLSNHIFGAGTHLAANSANTGQVRAVEALNEYSEARWVLNEIQKGLGGGDFMHAVSDQESGLGSVPRDYAVLYRNRWAAVAFQKLVAESGLPFQVVGDGSPYDHPHIQTILALLKACAGYDQSVYNGFSEAEWQAALASVKDASLVGPQAVAEKIIGVLGYEYGPDLQQFVGTLVRFPDTPAAIKYFDEIAKQDFYDPNADAITLLTIHASKGLEFSHVFLIGAEDGILPHSRAAPDEEKRLFYVAATRARNSLSILYTRKRGGHPAVLSPFVASLPQAALPKTTDPNMQADQLKAKMIAAKRSQQSLF